MEPKIATVAAYSTTKCVFMRFYAFAWNGVETADSAYEKRRFTGKTEGWQSG
jgi:hypothetical protein